MQEVTLNSTGVKQAVFHSAYQQRMLDNLMRDRAAEAASRPRQSAKDLLGDNVRVEISADSQAFIEAARQRKAAAAQKAPEVAETKANPFEGTGDLHKQYLVFSEYLHNEGFYDSMSDDQVRETEGLLRDITSSMDAISPGSLSATSLGAPSHAAAQVAFTSSVEALREFSDNYVPDTMRSGFNNLIAKFESYNSGIASSYRNILDRRDQALANLPKLDFDSYGSKDSDENAAKKLGSESYLEKDDQVMRDTAVNTFHAIRSGSLSLESAVRKLEAAFYTYAAHGSRNTSVTSLLQERNQGVFAHMSNYWGILLGSRSA